MSSPLIRPVPVQGSVHRPTPTPGLQLQVGQGQCALSGQRQGTLVGPGQSTAAGQGQILQLSSKFIHFTALVDVLRDVLTKYQKLPFNNLPWPELKEWLK